MKIAKQFPLLTEYIPEEAFQQLLFFMQKMNIRRQNECPKYTVPAGCFAWRGRSVFAFFLKRKIGGAGQNVIFRRSVFYYALPSLTCCL